MWHRVGTLLRARLAAGPRGGLPVAALLAQALIGATFCGVIRDRLPPFAYGVFALSLMAALVAIPLIGELGWMLRRDEAEEWVSALPVRARELKLARTLHLLLMLALLALGSLVPAAVLAPESTDLVPRLALPLLGLGLASLLAAVLLSLQNLLGERAEGLLVLLQTLLVIGVVVGTVLGLRSVPTLARIPTIGDEHAAYLWFFPPAWFAAPLASAEGEPSRWWLPLSAAAGAWSILLLLPHAAASRHGGSSWLDALLWPARACAQRFWVRRDERGVFDLVYDALPREREVVLRTVPMLGIPLAFLVIAQTGEDPTARQGILALLFFTVGVYLPILLTQVPASATPNAVWILSTAPVSHGAIECGTIKALAVRFLVPLYLLLGFVAWTQAGPDVVLRLALPGFLVSLLILRKLYPVCVEAPPLSTAPDELRVEFDWLGILAGIAFALTLVAVLANRYLDSVVPALIISTLLVVVDRTLDRRARAPRSAG